MKSKHTPGPWLMVEAEIIGRDYLAIMQSKLKEKEGPYPLICEITNMIHKTEEDVSNARLIAAAPDMLEALEEVIKSLETGKWNKSTYPMAKEAIKKAKGDE